jgi:hypothetical protein
VGRGDRRRGDDGRMTARQAWAGAIGAGPTTAGKAWAAAEAGGQANGGRGAGG